MPPTITLDQCPRCNQTHVDLAWTFMGDSMVMAMVQTKIFQTYAYTSTCPVTYDTLTYRAGVQVTT